MNKIFGRHHDGAAQSPMLDGFGSQIAALNQRAPSAFMQPFPGGRGYAHPTHGAIRQLFGRQTKIYAGEIHVKEVGENSRDHHRLMDSMAQHQNEFAGRIYMGTAGFLNLSYIAAMKPAAAILFDINPLQTMFWQAVFPLLAAERTPAKFERAFGAMVPAIQSRIFDALPLIEDGDTYFYARSQVKRKADFGVKDILPFREDPLHVPWERLRYSPDFRWWNNAGAYDYLHQMARRDALGTMTLDILDYDGWMDLAKSIAPKQVDVIYISNTMVWLDGQKDWSNRHKPGATPINAEKTMRLVMADKHAVIDHRAHPSLNWLPVRDEDVNCLHSQGPLRDVWQMRGTPKPQL